MSIEIGFPLEFVVAGTPVSHQAKRRESLDQWKSRVVEASRTILPEGHFATEDPLGITLYYIPDSEMQGDIDNIVKPILDALGRHVYIDDQQIQRILVQKFEPGNVFSFTQPSPMLENALEHVKPALYIRGPDDPFEDLV